MNTFNKSKYHIVIVSFYVLFCIYIFFFTEHPKNLFVFQSNDLVLLFPIMVSAVIVFFIANYFLKFGTIGLNRTNVSKLPIIILYASLLIAIPEEILFRGIIQTYLYSISLSIIFSIIASAFLFGFAHILNGSKGFSPKKWNWKLVAMTFLAGLFLGISFYVTGSLIIPIVLHTLFILLMKVFIKDTV